MSGPPPAQPLPAGRRPRWSKDAAKYLLDDEDAVIATRRHWAVLLRPALQGLPVLLAGAWLLLVDPGNPVGGLLGSLLAGGALGYLGLRSGEWWMRHFIVSRRRVLLTSGVVVRTVTLLPLRRVTDLTWKETLVGQVLGYGTFRFESAGQKHALSEITFLPDADALYRQVSRLLFGQDRSGAADGGDDEGNPDEVRRPPPTAGRAGERRRRDTRPIPAPPPVPPPG